MGWKEKLKKLTKKELFKALSSIYINPLPNKEFQEKYKASRDEMRKEIITLLKKYYPSKKETEKKVEQFQQIQKINLVDNAIKDFCITVEDLSNEIRG